MFAKKDFKKFRPLIEEITLRPLAFEEKTILANSN